MFCLLVCLFTTHVPGPCENQSRGSDPLEQELQVAVSNHMGARNRTPVPLKEQPVFFTAETSLQPPNT